MNARFYSSGSDGKVTCQLCPHACVLSDGDTGICRNRQNRSGEMTLVGYGVIASAGLDPIEKKPLFHFHPGRRVYSIGGYGCNLRCLFCQNHETSQCAPPQEVLSVIEQPVSIVDRAKHYSDCVGIAYTYNEPTVFFELMVQTATLAAEHGLHNVMVSNGFINREPLKELTRHIDAFNIDIKSFSDDFYRRMTGARLGPVLDSLITIRESGRHLELTYLVIPGQNDSPAEAEAMSRWIAENLGSDTPLHINRYFPSYRLKLPPTPFRSILDLGEIARNWLSFVYMGNLSHDSADSCTRCPSCGAVMVRRYGYAVTRAALDQAGCCSACGYGPVIIL